MSEANGSAVDKPRIEAAVREILLAIGEDPDRDGREPLDLLQELEEVLGIASYPMNWPIGMGKAMYKKYKEDVGLLF